MDLVERSYSVASRGMSWLCETSYKIARYAVPAQATELTISRDSTVFVLGTKYSADSEESVDITLKQIALDCSSRIWFTYRSGFEAIDGTHHRSDAGWGCMMRSGQMILAQAFAMLLFGREWRTRALSDISSKEGSSSDQKCDAVLGIHERDEANETSLVALFADTMDAPFSIHKIVLEGEKQGLAAGSWLGPTSISQVVATLVHRARTNSDEQTIGTSAATTNEETDSKGSSSVSSVYQTQEEAPDAPATPPSVSFNLSASSVPSLVVHVAMDGIVYLKNVQDLATQASGAWDPVLLLIPLRLGLEQLNEAYAPCIQGMLEFPQSLGIIGGRPRMSHFFIGYHGEQLLYLDPHEVQPALSQTHPALASCHYTSTIRSTPLLGIDPSLAIGFLCKSSDELDDLCSRCETVFTRGLPLFSISQGGPPEWGGSGTDDEDDSPNDGSWEDEDMVYL